MVPSKIPTQPTPAGLLTRPYAVLYQLLRSREAELPGLPRSWPAPAGQSDGPGSPLTSTPTRAPARAARRKQSGSAVPLGRVWGVPISLDWSWLLILSLMAWSLARGLFPVEHPGLPEFVYWGMAAATAILFCVSVLAHELAHTYVALKAGVRVRAVKLYLLGGAAELTREPRTPADEFRIAAAGPLTSLLLAAAFNLALQIGAPAYVGGPAEWLARTNLMLALFNLIPGLPLDGGRMLRAALWRWNGSMARATAIASGTGQVAAMGIMAWGVFTLIGGGLLNGIWLLVIGWFIQQAASATYVHTALRESLRGVTVAHVMSPTRPVVDPNATLQEVVDERILGQGERCFFVVGEEHDVLGVLTIRDVTAISRERWAHLTVADAMRPADEVVSVELHTELLEALQLMDDADVAQVPVVDGEAVEGMLSREQVLHFVRTRAELGL